MTNTVRNKDAIEEFLLARESIPVLRELIIPESCLASFKQFHFSSDEVATHCSAPYKAYLKNWLDAFCRPLDEIIFKRYGGPSALTTQYKNDLKENWYCDSDAKKRQARANKFIGKVFEFHTGIFLEEELGWSILDMEAFKAERGNKPISDLICKNKNGDQVAVAVKTLCKSPEMFELELQPFANKGSAYRRWSVTSPLDYLLFRLCEGAWSLQGFKAKQKVVVVPLLHIGQFQLQIDDNWIDFNNLQFFNSDDQMEEFWSTRQEARRKAQDTLGKMSSFVDGIIICDVQDGFELSIYKEHWY